jgi:hypothetical protein
MRQKPSVMLDRMWADQEAYIEELEAKVVALEAENFRLTKERFEQGERMTVRTLQLALSGQLDAMGAETLRACGYDQPRQSQERGE